MNLLQSSLPPRMPALRRIGRFITVMGLFLFFLALLGAVLPVH